MVYANATYTQHAFQKNGVDIQYMRNIGNMLTIELICMMLSKYCLQYFVFPYLQFCCLLVNFFSRSEKQIKSVHGIGF